MVERAAGASADVGLEQALRSRGLRATPQRRLVADAVADLGHATPDQVCARVQALAPALSRSTVYRTLELLEEIGVVTHTHLSHGASTYHLAGQADHLHLVCRGCGGVEEAALTLAAALDDAVRREHGFHCDVTHLSLHGLCRRCARHRSDDERHDR
jgi:Fur family ferric uptake transcriptional regulator